MSDYTPTPEQSAIVEAARKTKSNLLVQALAGAAKTSTIVLIAKALSTTPTLCVAFNKRIADEMKNRLPGHCTSRTLNSIGNEALKNYIGRQPVVDTKKNFNILIDLIKALDPREKEAAYDNFAEILRAIAGGKTCGYVPDGADPRAAHGLMDDTEFGEWLDEVPTRLESDLIRAASVISIRQALDDGLIDYDDQILIPVVCGAPFRSFPLTMVDEAQDLSALNHVMISRMVKTNRLIAVGDSCQAIYGFRGAHEDSMNKLKKQFKMEEFPLSISFRCPISVVKSAQWRAPSMRWPDWAAEGEVRTWTEWSADQLPQGSVAIICRNNAPLFGMAIKLLKNGRYPQLIGNDVGKGLLKIMSKLGKESLPRDAVLKEIAKWEADKLKKSRDPGKVRDQAACLRIFAAHGKDLGSAIAFATHIFNSTGPIQLMTGHKSKGLEFDDVFFLDPELIGNEGQERNLRYVIQTRAKRTLTYIQSALFEDNEGAA